MTKPYALILLFAAVCALCGCRQHASAPTGQRDYTPEYAHGFEIRRGADSGVTLTTITPWQGADSASARHFQVGAEPQRVVCMSSTHVAMLERLGLADRIVGASGVDRLSNQAVKAHANEVGYDSNIDYETLQSLRPDLVMLYGLNGPSPMEERLARLGIPYVYIAEYLESTPLGKAEWLVAVGQIFGKRAEAERVFQQIPERYRAITDTLKSARAGVATVMLNSPYGGTWMMPSMESYAARQLQDAGGRPVYDRINGTASKPIDLEQAYLLAGAADVWLMPGQIASMQEFTGQLPRFAGVKAVKSGNVWNATADYWERGVVNPDLVLKDLVNILHPGVLTDTVMTYFYQLP